MKRFTLCLALMLSMLLAVASTASADALAEIVKRGELRVAVQTQCPPFSFVDRNGDRSGSSVEFCKLMAKEMGVEIKFLDYDWDGLIPALLSGKADMLGRRHDRQPAARPQGVLHRSFLLHRLRGRDQNRFSDQELGTDQQERHQGCRPASAARVKLMPSVSSPMLKSNPTRAAAPCS